MPTPPMTLTQEELIQLMFVYLDHALGFGVTDTSNVEVLPPLKDYNKLKEEQKTLTKQALLGPIAAFLEASLIATSSNVGTNNTPVVIPLVRLSPTGTDGSITVTNGIITSVVNPTA